MFADGDCVRGHILVIKRFKGECRAPEAWTILRLVFLLKPDAKLEKGLRGFRAIALLSVFSRWYTTVLVDLLHEEKWRSLHVGAERGQLRTHADLADEYTAKALGVEGGSPDRSGTGALQIQHHFLASLDVKTVFDVAKPSAVSRILSLTGLHGHVAAALLAEMQHVPGSACFENCETEFRNTRCIRQGGVEAPVLWGRVAECVL